jgi:predicted peptidase
MTGFLDRKVELNGAEYRYQVYAPPEFTPERKWPVILFLHGAGECGEDGLLPTEVGIGTAIRRHRARFPALVVFPQLRPGAFWWGEMEAQALQALEQTIEEFNGDRNRLYLTGISRGGYGVWYIATRRPGMFAALAPVCGGISRPYGVDYVPHVAELLHAADPYAEAARRVGKTPVWIFHGADDNVIPVSESRQMRAALQAAGGHAKYTEYAGVGHDSWLQAYSEVEFMPWLLGQESVNREP